MLDSFCSECCLAWDRVSAPRVLKGQAPNCDVRHVVVDRGKAHEVAARLREREPECAALHWIHRKLSDEATLRREFDDLARLLRVGVDRGAIRREQMAVRSERQSE